MFTAAAAMTKAAVTSNHRRPPAITVEIATNSVARRLRVADASRSISYPHRGHVAALVSIVCNLLLVAGGPRYRTVFVGTKEHLH